MKLQIESQIISNYLPFNYQSLVVSLIKKALSDEDLAYFEEIYPKKGKPKTKSFTFSSLITNFEIEGSGADAKITGDKFITEISTIDMKFAIILYNGLIKMMHKDFVYKGGAIRIFKISRKTESQITSDTVEFRTLSPIYLKKKINRKDSPVDTDDLISYVSILNYISNISLKELRGFGLRKELEFMPLEYKKVVSQQKYSSQNENLKSLYKNVYKGSFVLRGDADDLRDLYNIGIGFSRGVGFGNIEVVRCF